MRCSRHQTPPSPLVDATTRAISGLGSQNWESVRRDLLALPRGSTAGSARAQIREGAIGMPEANKGCRSEALEQDSHISTPVTDQVARGSPHRGLARNFRNAKKWRSSVRRSACRLGAAVTLRLNGPGRTRVERRGDPPVQRHEGGQTWVLTGNPELRSETADTLLESDLIWLAVSVALGAGARREPRGVSVAAARLPCRGGGSLRFTAGVFPKEAGSPAARP